jgi:DNA-nicking Smr family endonuclease
MKEKKEQPAHDDAGLLRQALKGVTPLKPSGHATLTPASRKPPVRRAPIPPQGPDTLSDHGAGDEPLTEFLRPGLSRMTLRKLRRGEPPVQDHLDLHGLASNEARKLLQAFLREVTQRGLCCVRVVHGKGWQAGGGEGVLKNRTRHWLTQCGEVLAYCEAPPRDGGGGAVIVLLKRS